jgi:ATP-dependent exoDNAse (exonuclease V) beta subunit
VSEVAAASARLARARADMHARMARPLGAAASEDSHQRPEDGEDRGAPREGRRVSGSGGVAAAVGTAIHRALEEMDLSAPADAALARARNRVSGVLRAELPAGRAQEALEHALALLDRFAAGPLWPRLRELAPHVLARELPVLVAPGEDDAALGYVSGALDLVYRDPASGRIVVADYKTGARADHAAQGAVYTRALRRALDLDEEPRFELWYLAEGAIVPA